MSDKPALATMDDLAACANAWGGVYRDARDTGDTAKLVGSATLFLNEVGSSIPNIDANNSAHILILAIITALQESSHGKRTHPLLQSMPPVERVAGVVQRGIKSEHVSALGVGAVLFLEQQGWSTERACRHVSETLCGVPGVDGSGLSAVKKWLNEESLLTEPRNKSRRFVGLSTRSNADRASLDYSTSQGSNPGKFIKIWIHEQCAGLSSLLGR